jgi:hypothetical protein
MSLTNEGATNRFRKAQLQMIIASKMSPTQRPTFGVLAKKTMQKIALEEAISTHVFNPTTTLPPVEGTAELPYVNTHYVGDVKDRLTNVDARVKAMDEAGVALTVVSLTMPGIEGIFDPQIAVKTAQNVNDEIYELYTAGPHASRFRAFGCVAMQDPQAAATEAERCVQKLGFVGILINGYSNIGDANTVQYLDEPQLLLSGPRLRNSASRFIFIPVFPHQVRCVYIEVTSSLVEVLGDLALRQRRMLSD